MSSILALPSSFPSPSAAAGAVIARAARAWKSVTTVFAADAADTSDVWRLYHVARETDAVSVAAVNALTDKLKAD